MQSPTGAAVGAVAGARAQLVQLPRRATTFGPSEGAAAAGALVGSMGSRQVARGSGLCGSQHVFT